MEIVLNNKTAVVCGSSKGIGKAIAMQMAQAGANIVLVGRHIENIKGVLNDLPNNGSQKHQYMIADFSKPDSLKLAISNFLSQLNEIHILVNNTGGPPAGAAIDADIDEFYNAFNAHLICNHILTQAFVPYMKALGYGRIINIISTSVKQPIKGLGVSNTIRGAVGNWSKTLASELAEFGITVNNILPGATATERLSNIINNKAEKSKSNISEIEKEMLEEIPAKRFALPEEIAYAAVFLASPFAAYINGTNIVVDGGRTLNL